LSGFEESGCGCFRGGAIGGCCVGGNEGLVEGDEGVGDQLASDVDEVVLESGVVVERGGAESGIVEKRPGLSYDCRVVIQCCAGSGLASRSGFEGRSVRTGAIDEA
jgi:hypothetical protein